MHRLRALTTINIGLTSSSLRFDCVLIESIYKVPSYMLKLLSNTNRFFLGGHTVKLVIQRVWLDILRTTHGIYV